MLRRSVLSPGGFLLACNVRLSENGTNGCLFGGSGTLDCLAWHMRNQRLRLCHGFVYYIIWHFVDMQLFLNYSCTSLVFVFSTMISYHFPPLTRLVDPVRDKI